VIDPAATGPLEPDPSFVEELRRQLLAAAEREVRRRRRRRPTISAAVLVVAGAVALAVGSLVPRATPASADVVVRFEHGEVEILLVDPAPRPDRIRAAVARAGLDVQVDPVPVGPSLVGRFVGDRSTGPLPPELHRIGDGDRGFRGFALPEGWPGSLHLLIGAPAAPGERYARFSDATAAGEPLACRAVAGQPAAVVARQLPPGTSARFAVTQGTETRLLPPEALGPEGRARWLVAGADSPRAGSVLLRLVPPGTPVPVPPLDPECR
jgi:hypothetical protein